MTRWTNANAIYQIYPRSFRDSNGDGVGDLAGITEKLSHIKGDKESLGIDAIWISPFFTSPMADFGYDVSNYTDVDPIFGTIDDFDELIREANRRQILVMIDFVPNHSSDQHEWFRRALESPDSKYRNFYQFRDPAPDGGPPNNWLSVFGGSAWELDEASGQYYLHSFLKEQPDLNWRNPELRQAMGENLRFWLDRGVKGFRFDAVRWMANDEQYRDNPSNPDFIPGSDPYHAQLQRYSRYGEHLDEYLHFLTDIVDGYPNTLVILEDYNDKTLSADAQIKRMYGINSPVSVPINLEITKFELLPRNFAVSVARYQRNKAADSDMVLSIGNHDKPRVVTRYGREAARLVAMMQLTLPGLPIIYYGEEIGMSDQPIRPDQVQDPFEKNVPGKGLGRDPQRTPMQWDDSRSAGFSDSGETWLPIGGDYQETNVIEQLKDDESFFAMYRQLLKLRHELPVLRKGNYETMTVGGDVFYYDVHDDEQRLGVVLNFSDTEQSVLSGECEIIFSLCGEGAVRGRQTVVPASEGVIIRYL